MKRSEKVALTRAKCTRLLKAHLGEAGFREFLRNCQPAFADRTGQDLLENEPKRLLSRLEMLEGRPE